MVKNVNDEGKLSLDDHAKAAAQDYARAVQARQQKLPGSAQKQPGTATRRRSLFF